MTKKELIYAEIDNISEENLDDLYEIVKAFAQAQALPNKPGALSKLKQIKIQGPPDFAANLDQYLTRLGSCISPGRIRIGDW